MNSKVLLVIGVVGALWALLIISVIDRSCKKAYNDGYNLGQKEADAYKIELDRALEMYTDLLSVCRGNQ